MVQISVALPIQLLKFSRLFNDYEFASGHLLLENDDYATFYKLISTRDFYINNSSYELGEPMDSEDYGIVLRKFNPTHYILPDFYWRCREDS